MGKFPIESPSSSAGGGGSRKAHLRDLGERKGGGHTGRGPMGRTAKSAHSHRDAGRSWGRKERLSAGARQAEIGDYRVSQRIRMVSRGIMRGEGGCGGAPPQRAS